MSDKFIINGGQELKGEVEINGSKNAAGPILMASLLTKEECIIKNLPHIEDITSILEMMESIGVEVEKRSDRSVSIKSKEINTDNIDLDRSSKTRLSVLFFGALLSRSNNFKMTPPGGDRIGLRPISVQLHALQKLGVIIEKDRNIYNISHKGLRGAKIILEEFSVTATEAVMLASVLAEGKTIIKGAAAEPHVQDLGDMLLCMGANIKGLGTHTIEIEGVKDLHGCEHTVISDYIEAGTFIVAGAITPGKIKVKNIHLNHLDLFLAKLEQAGVKLERGEDYVIVHYSPDLKGMKVQALPYPGFPTDLLPIIVPLLLKAKGISLIHDPLYENRFSYAQELRKMGANIKMVDAHRAFVFGPSKLVGAKINSNDIRAGACQVVAALSAKGETTISNVFQIDRGYEKIEERLQKLGADIKRISVK